jgi:dTDP-4-dehydrorhamnose reductase
VRVLVTGGAGFVGSNVVAAAAERGDEVVAVVRSLPPLTDPACRYVLADLLDVAATRAVVKDAGPDVIVHTAILNDFIGIYGDRRAAWDSYVGVTSTLADAANDHDAALLTVSTDWVFDGTQAGAGEATPPNPINYYGVLKLTSEVVTLERAREPIVARIAGVMGTHRAGRQVPRSQDAGFGYFASAVVDTLAAGLPFTVWESDSINMVATPSLVSVSAAWMLELAERGVRGIFHCCGGEPTTRMGLARQAARAFGLDETLLRSGPPDEAALPPAPIPYDTSLDAQLTGRVLERALPSVAELLGEFRDERLRVGQPVATEGPRR